MHVITLSPLRTSPFPLQVHHPHTRGGRSMLTSTLGDFPYVTSLAYPITITLDDLRVSARLGEPTSDLSWRSDLN